MIPYLRHPNGRGKLFDDAEANRATFIDRASSAVDSAKLRDCRLRSSRVADHAQIYGGELRNSFVCGHTIIAGSPVIDTSYVDCSEVSGSPHITHCRLRGNTEICDTPTLQGDEFAVRGQLLLADAIIYGCPTICGSFTVTGRVHEGHWTRAPKHIKLPWCDLSECIDGKVILDCRCRPFEYWMRHGAKLARRWDWSEDQIEVTMDTIRREFVDAAHHESTDLRSRAHGYNSAAQAV